MTTAAVRRSQGNPRAPGLIYGAMSLVVLLLVAVMALTARQTPPPSIAELAPQAVEQIKDAPAEQSSDFGSGEGGEGGRAGATTTTTGLLTAPPPRAVIDQARVRRCIGDPPRQIEDPQSPPCVPYWDGDNGGSTWRGVTRDEIRIGFVNSPWVPRQALENFFNARFEFYGRKLRLLELGDGGNSDAGMVADAVQADEELDVFAVGSYRDRGGDEKVFYDELARREILSVNNRPVFYGERHFRDKHPYQWSYLPGFDVMARAKGRWVCRALAGRPAEWARGVDAGKPRVFGIVYSSKNTGARPDVDILVDELSKCDVVPAAVVDSGEAGAANRNAVVQMQAAGVTTVLCECHSKPMSDATTQGWFPEWVMSTFMYSDDDLNGQLNASTQQMDQAIALGWWNKQGAVTDSAWNWAVKEGDPNYVYSSPPNDYYDARWTYHSMLVLASGIQMAGPNLTPETFANGLKRAKFPNPNAGDAPYYQARIDFSDDHTAQEDAAVLWWSTQQQSSWGGTGTWCYSRLGLRFGSDRDFPRDTSGIKTGPCR